MFRKATFNLRQALKVVVLIIILTSSLDAYCVDIDFDRLAPHPRLLLPTGGEERIKQAMTVDSGLTLVHERILDKCREMLTAKPVERIKQGKRLLGVSREALQRIYYLSYAYRMTGDMTYARRAEQELLAVCDFSDWNPSHFLDVGEMVMAIAIGYDWLYDELAPETRSKVRQAIVEKGFKAAENEKDAWFYNSKTNWNSVCNGGLLYGALAIYEDQPEEARAIIEKCIETNPKVMDGYGPDGGYPEGFMYWGYGTAFQVLLIDALESALGTDFDIASAPGFLDSARFMQFMSAPSGRCFNFSDAHPIPEANMMLFWFADKLNDPSVVYIERKYLVDKNTRFAEPRLLPSLMIFASRLNLDNIKAPEGQYWLNDGDTPVFIFRSGWDSPDDTYLGVKGGSASTSHAHMDGGAFVYERDGVRWAIDLGMQDYYSLESAGVDLWNQRQDGERWDVFRIGNKAHNTLTVNDRRHSVGGKAIIADTYRSAERKGATVDLSPLFPDGLDMALRTVALDSNDNLEVTDSLKAPADREADVMWVMATECDARVIDDRSIELTQGGQQMLLTVDAGVLTPKMQVWTNEPPHDYDAPNPGSRRVGFTTRIPAGEVATLKVSIVKH